MGADCGEQPMRGGTTKGGDLPTREPPQPGRDHAMPQPSRVATPRTIYRCSPRRPSGAGVTSWITEVGGAGDPRMNPMRNATF